MVGDETQMDWSAVEFESMGWISRTRDETSLYRMQRWLGDERPQLPNGTPIGAYADATIWSLLRRGMIYIRFSPSQMGHSRILLTDIGREALEAGEYLVYDAKRYVDALEQRAPGISDVVLAYASEAINTFWNQNYMASAVMLGVASEAGFLDLCESFVQWLPHDESEVLQRRFSGTREYNRRFRLFLDAVELHSPTNKCQDPKIDQDLYQNIDVEFNGILNIIRRYRNDAGHPTEQHISRTDVRDLLILFHQYTRRMYELKYWFEEQLRQRRLDSVVIPNR